MKTKEYNTVKSDLSNYPNLYNYLEKNNLLDTFIKQFLESNYRDNWETIDDCANYIDHDNPVIYDEENNILCYCFEWGESIEGFKFWGNVQEQVCNL